ncbi:hypothetical protein GGI20_003017 [Coemansia sp. BCRC 34301]|nr:hypothetical protein GGI20_003017 [Coemansia sp. BCRC 34301]
MASLLATTAPLPVSRRLDAIDDTTTADSPPSQLAKSALLRLAAEEVDTAFSPLSSSAITIASLGSSLGYGSSSDAKRESGGGYARQPVDKALQENEQLPARQLGLRGASAASTQDDSLVTSSANLSTAVSSSAVSSHSSKSSSSSAGPTVDMSRATNMRSVSVDYARAYGLHMKRNMASATAAAGDITIASSSPPKAHIPPSASSFAYNESGISSSATSLSGIHRTLTKRFWRPLARRSDETTEESAFKQQPLAIDEDEDDEGLYLESKARNSQDTCADNDVAIVDRDSVANSSSVGAEHGARLVLPPSVDDKALAATPHPSAAAAAPYQLPRNYRFGRAVHSKSLDVARIATDPAYDDDDEKKTKGGALNRRVLQRSKREDAIYGVVATTNPADECLGPERFQALPRSFVSRLGFASTLAARRRPDDLRFVIMPHPQFAEVTEIYDCDERTPVYRKISRSGRSWHETFHEVNCEEELAELEAAKQQLLWRQQQQQQRHSSALAMGDYEMASALGLPYPGFAAYGGKPMTFSAAASCVTIQSSAVGTNSYANGGMSNQSTASFLLNSGTVRMARASTSIGASTGGGGTLLDRGLLWEALTPYPNKFPLHIKDMREVIDTLSLASMVLDRHQFCYRFQLGSNRMRWTAKRIRKHQLALVCTVRSAVVAEIFIDFAKGYSPLGATSVSSTGGLGSLGSNGAIDIELLEDGSYPVVTILQTAFEQLADFDSEVVESFLLFTGLQVLECLHI